MSVKSGDIAAIVELFEQSGWDELHVDMDGLHLFLSTRPNARLALAGDVVSPVAPQISAAAPAAATTPAPAAAKDKAAPKASKPESIPDSWIAVKAPNLGTFYRAPKPGAAPFVEIGQTIDADADICLLEVMKLFTAVKAGIAGKVVSICVSDAEMVEFGQPLFYIEQA